MREGKWTRRLLSTNQPRIIWFTNRCTAHMKQQETQRQPGRAKKRWGATNKGSRLFHVTSDQIRTERTFYRGEHNQHNTTHERKGTRGDSDVACKRCQPSTPAAAVAREATTMLCANVDTHLLLPRQCLGPTSEPMRAVDYCTRSFHTIYVEVTVDASCVILLPSRTPPPSSHLMAKPSILSSARLPTSTSHSSTSSPYTSCRAACVCVCVYPRQNNTGRQRPREMALAESDKQPSRESMHAQRHTKKETRTDGLAGKIGGVIPTDHQEQQQQQQRWSRNARCEVY